MAGRLTKRLAKTFGMDLNANLTFLSQSRRKEAIKSGDKMTIYALNKITV